MLKVDIYSLLYMVNIILFIYYNLNLFTFHRIRESNWQEINKAVCLPNILSI